MCVCVLLNGFFRFIRNDSSVGARPTTYPHTHTQSTTPIICGSYLTRFPGCTCLHAMCTLPIKMDINCVLHLHALPCVCVCVRWLRVPLSLQTFKWCRVVSRKNRDGVWDVNAAVQQAKPLRCGCKLFSRFDLHKAIG